MEEHESFLVGIKFLLNIWCMSLQMKTQQIKGTSFSFYLEKCFPLFSPVCFILKLSPCKKSIYNDSDQMAPC